MKLLYITNGISATGGLERVLSVKATYFADVYNYEVHIITLNEEDKKPFYPFSDKIRIHNISIKSIFSYISIYIPEIRRLIIEIAPDIISVCDDGLKGLLVPFWLKRGYRSIIYERHVSKVIQLKGGTGLKHRLVSKLMEFGANKFDKFVVLTAGNVEEWKGVKNVVVIPNPVPFYPKQQSCLTNKRVITVGRFVYQKGYEYLIDIWSKVNLKFPDWHLDIYGCGPEEEHIKSMIRDRKTVNICLHKPFNNILEKYLSSSIYVLTSRFEGFGMVLIEAMSCGVPCVSFDCPCGPKDIIDNGKTGFLIPLDKTDQFVERLTDLIQNEKLRSELGTNARIAAARYLPKNICRKWDNMFRELLH